MKVRSRTPKRSTSGYTLIEMLVILLIIGVLFAIAAPGWNAFLSRQQLSSARERVAQIIQTTQSDAKRTATARILVFDKNEPRYATEPLTSGTLTPTNWKPLSDGTTQTGSVSLSTSTASNREAIIFDSNGTVPSSIDVITDAEKGTSQTITQTVPFIVKVAKAGDTDPRSQRCVIIETLLGSTRLEEGTACN